MIILISEVFFKMERMTSTKIIQEFIKFFKEQDWQEQAEIIYRLERIRNSKRMGGIF